MKFFRIIGVFLTLFVVNLVFESCIDNRCPKSKKFEYSILSFSLTQLDLEVWFSALPDYVEFRRDFGVQFIFETEKTVMAKNCKPVNSLFMRSVYALDCVPDTYFPKEKIISIQVFSDKDFGETHPAGTDVAEFFKVLMGFDIVSFESFFENPVEELSFLLNFVCVLTATNIKAGEYEFTFVVNLSDERTLEQSIKSVLE